jgi:4-hydroxybenzoate polyprenyltransferase
VDILKLNPLVIDLDGTLLHSDLLIESGLAHIRGKPFQALHPLLWLIQGKARLKEKLAHSAKIDVSTLPYNDQVLSLITEERAKGRSLILATASHKIYAAQIAEHLGLFDRVLATEGRTNLSAENKRDLLVAEFGESGFDYMGNSHDDLPVWKSARHAFIVNPEKGLETKAQKLGNVEAVITTPSANRFRLWAKELRFHQWLKNLLIFVPLLASHELSQVNLVVNGLLAFLFFGMCASSVYLLNDLLDLADDRHHSSKRHRPFASGSLSVKSGLLAFPILLAAAFAGSIWLLPWQFGAALASYYLLTLAYSVALKRLMMVDVIALGMLYTLRIIAGTFAFGVSLTFWMLAFSMFIFLSLALVKRYAELREAKLRGKTEKTRGRGYYPDDLEMIASLGGASGYLSVMVLALYIQEPKTVALYRHPELIWLSCPLLLFWISRTWMLTHRGHMHDDPVVFAIKDRVSLTVGLLFAATFWFAA